MFINIEMVAKSMKKIIRWQKRFIYLFLGKIKNRNLRMREEWTPINAWWWPNWRMKNKLDFFWEQMVIKFKNLKISKVGYEEK